MSSIVLSESRTELLRSKFAYSPNFSSFGCKRINFEGFFKPVIPGKFSRDSLLRTCTVLIYNLLQADEFLSYVESTSENSFLRVIVIL